MWCLNCCVFPIHYSSDPSQMTTIIQMSWLALRTHGGLLTTYLGGMSKD